MKFWTITLARPAIVNTNPLGRGDGELRYPSEGSLNVCEQEAERLFDNNLLASEPELVKTDDQDDDDDTAEVPDDLKGLKVAELKAKALADGVPLNDANTKPTIIAAFVAHRAAAA